MVGVKMPISLYKELREMARSEDRTVSACIRRMVADTLEQRKQAAADAPEGESRS
jgi:hypothetical protein